MNWHSVRTRLILWNVAVLAAVLGAFGLAIRYSVEASQARMVDRDLERRLERPPWARGGRGGPGGPGGRPGWEFRGDGRGSRPPWARRDDRPDGQERRDGRQAFQAGAAQPGPRSDRPDGQPGREGEPRDGDRRPFRDREGPGPAVPGRTADSREAPSIDFRRPRALGRDGRAFGPDAEGPWDPRTFQLSLVGQKRFSTIAVDGDPVRVLSQPIVRDGRVEGVLQVAHSLVEQQQMTAGLVRILLMLIPAGLLVAGVGALFLTDRALRPVREVTQAAAQIGAEDLSRRLTVTGRDEIAELAGTFNGMIGRLDAAFTRLREAYEEQRRFTSDASHELRTPLTAIKANTSLALMEERSPEDYRAALEAADQAADVMTRIVQDLLFLARADADQLAMETQPTSLESVVRRATSLVRRPERAPIHVSLPSDPVIVLGDEHHLVRLVTNVLENALRHTPADGRIAVTVAIGGGVEGGGWSVEGPDSSDSGRSTPHALRSTATITVADTGEGIAPEHLPRLGERFYRVDAARARSQGGTGLGLAICRSIVQAHGGTLSLDSVVGQGTTVTIRLPNAIAVGEPEEAAWEAPARGQAPGTGQFGTEGLTA